MYPFLIFIVQKLLLVYPTPPLESLYLFFISLCSNILLISYVLRTLVYACIACSHALWIGLFQLLVSMY